MSWKKLFLTDDSVDSHTKEKKEVLNKANTSEIISFPKTNVVEEKQPFIFTDSKPFQVEIEKPKETQINYENAHIDSISKIYENGFNQLNKEGVDFFEFYQSVTNSDINNPDVYKMAFNLLKGMDPSFTKERALSDANYYIDKITDAYNGIKNSSENLISQLSADKESEEKNLIIELSELESQSSNLKLKLDNKKIELSLVDAKFSTKFSDARMKYEANEVVKTSLTDKINTVVTNIKNNI